MRKSLLFQISTHFASLINGAAVDHPNERETRATSARFAQRDDDNNLYLLLDCCLARRAAAVAQEKFDSLYRKSALPF
jgi:methionine synthase II (cobalamin-independent)